MNATRALPMAVLLGVSSLTVMAGAAISPALPVIEAHFADRPRAALLVKLLLTLPALFIVIGAPLAGYLVDRWGRRGPLLWSVVVYAIAGGSGLVLSTLPALLVGRAVLGLAVAGVMTSATAMVGDLFEGAARERFFGWQGAAMGLSGVGLTLGSGALAELGWRWPFVVYLAALIFVPLVVKTFGVARRRRKSAAPGPVGQPQMVGEDSVESGPAADRSPRLQTAGSAASLAQPPESAPSLPKTGLACLLGFIGMAFFYMVPVQLPFLIERLTGETGLMAGIPLAALPFFGMVTALNYHRLRRTLRIAALFALLFLIMGGGYICLAVAESYRAICLGSAISGLGLGLMMPNLQIFALRGVGENWRGRVSGGLTTSLFLGQFVSPLLVWPVVRWLEPAGEDALSKAFGLAGIVMVALGMIFAAWTALVRRAES